ncbi:nephronectin-like [Branchiostoma lanceolatum]|uniref:nephronectin-like n=1 Tax=Branchiostoma lanceolatum TaxID=7740 RepID=UPI003452C9FF
MTCPCHVKATCTNTDGSFCCNCSVGYTGDGFNCTDIDECMTSPCHDNAAYTNTDGSFSCNCTNGYSGDGFNCTAEPTTEQPTTVLTEPIHTLPPTEEATALSYTTSEATPSVTVQTDPEMTSASTATGSTYSVEPSTIQMTTVGTTTATDYQNPSTSSRETTDMPPTTLAASLVVPVTDCRVDRYVPGAGIDIITSHDYPKLYPSNLDCWYVITTDPGYALHVTILNFDLPDSSSNDNASECTDDYLEIHAPLGAPPSQRYCGQAFSPGTTFPSGTRFALHFVTDREDTWGGFSALVTSVSASSITVRDWNSLPQDIADITELPAKFKEAVIR